MIEQFPSIPVVGAGSRASSAALRDHLIGSPLRRFPHIDDASETLWERFGAFGRSTFVFFDASGGWQRFDYGDLDSVGLAAQFELLARGDELPSAA